MTTWLCKKQTHHDGKSKITVYVASSFLSTASTETWSPIVGIILTACMCVCMLLCAYTASGLCIMQSTVKYCAPFNTET